MQPIAVVSCSVLLSAVAAVAANLALRPAPEAAPGSGAADLQHAIAELRTAQRELQQRFENLAAPRPETAAPAGAERVAVPQLDERQVAAAVEAYLRRRAGAAEPAEAAAAEPFDPERAYAELKGQSYWENSAGWKRAFASGRMDELIAQFEAAAKANPRDTKTLMQLATAYLAYNQMDQSKWQLSMKADGVFDRVLEQDPAHWQARFTKAVSYTFWPEFLGKKGEAITHFETLVQQQAAMPPEPAQAQTYLFLGNLLEARDPARARAVWAQGAARHPENQELQQKRGS